MPEIEQRLENDDLILLFDTLIAYPIKICIRLLENSLNEEGLFRIALSQGKQKKNIVAELNLQTIDRGTTLNQLNYEPRVSASILKQYLRELPDHLLTTALLPQWNEIISLRLTLFSLFLIQSS
ncbi:unnamed protein product [Rotaria sordida]|uniref:Rho-GAP domain-containing protein n=1 Tax=Rotaria sordida TaxID=392033 RepID=A0A815AXU2_9BILA|nr:unnamed protein product [Rotaria sordida]